MDSNLPDWRSFDPLPRAAKTVLVLDLVESVRLMEQDEAGTVHRWQGVQRMVTGLLDKHHGRLVKSLGDGMMLEFEYPERAARCAMELHGSMSPLNAGCSDELHMQLRVGIHRADVYVDAADIYGAGVNLAARLASLAGPGEIVISPEVRDALIDDLDACTEDMGDCYLKHMAQPVRAFRLTAADGSSVPRARLMQPASLQPTIAVIPFHSHEPGTRYFAIGDLVADSVIAQLSISPSLRIVSRLSTNVLRHRGEAATKGALHLGANYVVSGSYVVHNNRILLSAELAETASNSVVWAGRVEGQLGDLFAAQSQLTHDIASAVHMALLKEEVGRASGQPLPALPSYTLLLGAVTLMHRQSVHEFDRASTLLEHLIERHPGAVIPRAWHAKWRVLRVAQGFAPDPLMEARLAEQSLEDALDREPDNAFALALSGLVRAYVRKDLDGAQKRYDAALNVNPSESLGWLFSSTLHSYRGEGQAAAHAARKALSLSPLDPASYYYDSLAATAILSSGAYDEAIGLARRSLRANRFHTSTYRALAIAQGLSGRTDDARETVKQLLQLEPDLTVQGFLRRYPGSDAPHARAYGDALLDAGLPAV